MRGLAVDGAQRSPLFPDIPTLAELGYRGNLNRVFFVWFAFGPCYAKAISIIQ